jgi:hypothetical protein
VHVNWPGHPRLKKKISRKKREAWVSKNPSPIQNGKNTVYCDSWHEGWEDKGCKQGLSFVKEHLLATKAGHHSHLLRE